MIIYMIVGKLQAFDSHRTWAVRAFASKIRAQILLSDLNIWLMSAQHDHNKRLKALKKDISAIDLSSRWDAIATCKAQSVLKFKNQLDPQFIFDENCDINNYSYLITEVEYED